MLADLRQLRLKRSTQLLQCNDCVLVRLVAVAGQQATGKEHSGGLVELEVNTAEVRRALNIHQPLLGETNRDAVINLPNACGAGKCAGHWWILLG